MSHYNGSINRWSRASTLSINWPISKCKATGDCGLSSIQLCHPILPSHLVDRKFRLRSRPCRINYKMYINELSDAYIFLPFGRKSAGRKIIVSRWRKQGDNTINERIMDAEIQNKTTIETDTDTERETNRPQSVRLLFLLVGLYS